MIPEQVEKAITKKTKAIIPVHIYGNPCDMDALTEISERYGVTMLEDATEKPRRFFSRQNDWNLWVYGLLLLQWGTKSSPLAAAE